MGKFDAHAHAHAYANVSAKRPSHIVHTKRRTVVGNKVIVDGRTIRSPQDQFALSFLLT